MGGEVAEITLMADLGSTTGNSEMTLLIERAREGDAAAFDQIMVCYQRTVISTAWRLLGNREDARDAAQEVFLRVYKYLGRFKRGEDFAGWLYRITVNVCNDMRRKRKQTQQISSLDDNEIEGNLERIAGGSDAESSAIRSQQRTIIAEALGTLTEKERAAVVLRDLEGLSTDEVARVLGSSRSTVRSQISYGRAKIKKYRDRLLSRGYKRDSERG
ncbi:MAG TPA: RNA polymerase sigma factor [Blastocatellia bacterium]|nr:RNA polymerase sigma factor [Blastocatellia bacterium]